MIYLEIQADIYLPDGRESFTAEDEEALDDICALLETRWPSAWSMSAGFTEEES